MNQEMIETAARAVCDSRHAHHATQRDFWAGCDEYGREQYRDDARAVIAAIHPTVSTVEELDALGFEAVVLDPCGTPAVCGRSGPDFCEWEYVGTPGLMNSGQLLESGTECVVLYPGGAA